MEAYGDYRDSIHFAEASGPPFYHLVNIVLKRVSGEGDKLTEI